MERTNLFDRSFKDILVALGPSLLIIFILAYFAYKFVNPAPPKHIVISTSDGEGDYQTYAKLYQEIIKEDGVDLEIRTSTGATDNLHKLEDPNSGVDVGFVQDGLGSSEKDPDLSSLGSLYYEPVWVFYSGKTEITRFAQLLGKRISIGKKGGGTHSLSHRLLRVSGVTDQNSTLINMDSADSVEALKKNQIDAAIFIATPEDSMIADLIKNRVFKLMNTDQADALSRQMPFLHHLILPHGTLDLKNNLPAQDINLVAPTATLLVRDSLHPALQYLLLKAASQVHGDPGIFEKKDEFPIDKDFEFPLSSEAKRYYKTGTPFWQRYLPFWLATLVDRFILIVIPLMALVIPVVKLVPRILTWRVKSRFYDRYGELKHLESEIGPKVGRDHVKDYLITLDKIEERVNRMKAPLDFSDQLYGLREHIHFVRQRLERATDLN